MAADDRIKPAVVAALVKDGWTITHDPLRIKYGGVRGEIDLGAERLLAAERGAERIAVEIKSFIGPSPVADFQQALGQFGLYHALLKRLDPGRTLFLAVDQSTHSDLFSREGIQAAVADFAVPVLVVALPTESVSAWIQPHATGRS